MTLWQGICIFAQVPPYILPTAMTTVYSLYEHGGVIAYHALISLGALLVGLFVAVGSGTISAVWLYHAPGAARLLKPFLLVMQSTPSFVLFPLLMVWFGYGFIPKILIIALSCYFPICLCFWDALNCPPKELVHLGQTLGANPMRLFLYVRLPASMPGLLSGLQLAAIHAPITTLASEWMGAQSGLGYLIMLAHGRLEMDFLFATLLVLITVTALFAKVMEKIQRKVLFWTW